MSFMREILSKLPPDLLRYCNTETTWLGKEVKQYANLAEIPPLREDPAYHEAKDLMQERKSKAEEATLESVLNDPLADLTEAQVSHLFPKGVAFEMPILHTEEEYAEYYVDMIRNPGSTREGLHLAEKTVGGLYQRCYASSCEIPIIQEMATRNWYKTDKSLDVGSVTVRKVDQPFGFVPNVGGSSFAWWPWVLLTLLILGCILCLGRLFFMPKMTPKRIGSVKKTGWDPNYDLGMKGDSETEPLKVPMNAHRDPYDRRDVQNLGTLPTGTDIQMPDMSKYPGQSSFNASFPRAPPPPPMAYPAPHIPAQPSVAPPVTAAPVTYQSLQGYQGSMPMPMTPQLVSPPAPSYPMGDGSLLALFFLFNTLLLRVGAFPRHTAETSQCHHDPPRQFQALSGQLASQLENSGAEACWQQGVGRDESRDERRFAA
ncbi:unnamed protein product [Durusdinium trenchii]|uniref:Uncharacterized protein n=1 Tax=Durusdinium trenchii TaxID=1381693 RepID=A0ABP0NTV4_9DINO